MTRSPLRAWKLYVLDKYKYLMQRRGHYISSMRPSEANRLLKAEGSGSILESYFAVCPRNVGVDTDTVWEVYAVKQKRHHRNGAQEQQTYHQRCSACYVCGSQVGIADDSDVMYPWNSTVVVKGNKCRDITNYRICCDDCHHGSSNYDSLYQYALSNYHTKKTSLAVRDEITDLAEAYKVCHHRYVY